MMNPYYSTKPRSFVRRGRGTLAQIRARERLWPLFGLHFPEGLLSFKQTFDRQAPCFLEIGFGSGQSLLALAKAHPENDFIGIETHLPGIGALLAGMEKENLTNIRIYEADAEAVIAHCLPNNSLSGAQLFFPDPWPKRKHHARRLVQTEFVHKLTTKLKPNAYLHLATDWEDYAAHMMNVLTREPVLCNLAGQGHFSERSPYRPVVTKFEQRAIKEGRAIYELQFRKHQLK